MEGSPKAYTELGGDPMRKSTINAKAAGLKMVNTFLVSMQLHPLPPSKDARNQKGYIKEKVMCQVSMFRKLATYMLELKKPDGSWKYRPFTAKNRIGEAKLQVEKIFGNNCVNKNDKANTEVAGTKRNEQGDDAWFIILRKKLDKEMFYRCFMSGTFFCFCTCTHV